MVILRMPSRGLESQPQYITMSDHLYDWGEPQVALPLLRGVFIYMIIGVLI